MSHPQTQCSACSNTSNRHPPGDVCHNCGAGIMRASPGAHETLDVVFTRETRRRAQCRTCKGTGRDPASDTAYWLTCPECGGGS
jgi:Zn finger protein HypA/HybF involved in hydrogenase expression